MADPWSPFYWRDYIAATGHLTLEQHGAYLLLMAHYYMTGRPLPANASVLHRVCRCTSDADRTATEQVLREFFILDGEFYRHHRIERELAKAIDISEKRRAAANVKHQKSRANACASVGANAEQVHTQPQPQPHKKAFMRPTLEEIAHYCLERGNQIDPQQFVDHYSANGWKVGRNPMRDWKAAVRTWERSGLEQGTNRGNQKANRAEQRQDASLAAREVARAAIMAS